MIYSQSKFPKSWLQVIKKFLSLLVTWKQRKKFFHVYEEWKFSNKIRNGCKCCRKPSGQSVWVIQYDWNSERRQNNFQVSNMLGLSLFSRKFRKNLLSGLLCWKNILANSESLYLFFWVRIIVLFIFFFDYTVSD